MRVPRLDVAETFVSGVYVVLMGTTVRQSVTLTKPQHEVLATEAERLGITVSDLIRRIVDEWREKRG